jgi:hypothetical protein
MRELTCPKCGAIFSVDEADYAAIVSQVRGNEFDAEVSRRIAELHKQQDAQQQAREAQASQAHQKELSAKDKVIGEKDSEILRLKEQLSAMGERRELELSAAVTEKDKEIAALKATIDQGAQALEIAVLKERQQAKEAAQAKDAEIAELKSQARLAESEANLREKSLQTEYEGKLQVVKSEAESRLRLAKEEVERLKDFKTRLSTKMVGESLEQHCQNQFNAIRMTAFPNAYFEKDNEVSGSGSKGDFIFREADNEGTEFISIMFEMKNEMETTATKHKNEDFFKELDKDRNEKGCEYAVLVSLLEADNDLYNNGIVDVSYKYPKMYVIRPQFFIPMITLLRNAALNSLQYQKELAVVRNQQLDLYNFEANMQEFKDSFGRNYRIASEKFQTAIDEIDKTIDHLEKVKKALQSSENNLRIANDKADDLTIKKLTKNAPSVKQMFDDLNKEGE